MRARWTAVLTMVAMLGSMAPRPSWAYAVPIHELLPERTLGRDPRMKSDVLPAASRADLDAFRLHLDALFRAHPDEKVRAEYVRRWPTPEHFTAAEFKRLMGLNTQKDLNGFDKAEGLPGTPLQVISKGSSQPDTDFRNRDRLALDEKGEPLKLPDGRVVPADPAVLNMGSATGKSSQAHAHYGLADVKFTSDPDMLKVDPRRFAIAAGWPGGPIKAMARENTQLHYDLAVLAALSGLPSGPSLSHLYFGHSLHYLGDVGNQVHTVQVGLYDIFVNAKFVTWERSLKTLGGHLGELRPFTSVGLDMLTTHHILSEALNRRRIMDALEGKPVPEPVTAALSSLTQDDGAFKQELEMKVGRTVAKLPKKHYLQSATLVASHLIEASAPEGGEVYRHTAGALHPRMSEYGVRVEDDPEDPDSMLADVNDPYVKAHLESLYWLQAKAFARIGSAFRFLYSRYVADSSFTTEEERTQKAALVAQSLLGQRLKELQAEEARLASFLKDPPPPSEKTVKSIPWLVGPILLPILLVAALVMLVRLMRRRPQASEEEQLPV